MSFPRFNQFFISPTTDNTHADLMATAAPVALDGCVSGACERLRIHD
jgi:hypothetical protein